MNLTCLEVGAASAIGSRAVNADAHLVDPAAGFLAVSDGMGDTPRSASVAHVVLDAVRELFLAPWSLTVPEQRCVSEAGARLRLGVSQANGRTFADGRPEDRRVGATFAGAVVCRDHVCVGSVGDARIFLFRPFKGRIVQLTQDDTALNAAVWRGVAYDVAAAQPKAHALTRAVGLRNLLDLRPMVTRWEPGDVLLLATDGITDWLDAAAISRTLGESDDLSVAAERLVRRALAAGGWDNATAVVARRAPSNGRAPR